MADSVEKVPSTETPKISSDQIDIYIRLLSASQFDLERSLSRRRAAMRPSASLFGKRTDERGKIWSTASADFFNRIDPLQS